MKKGYECDYEKENIPVFLSDTVMVASVKPTPVFISDSHDGECKTYAVVTST